MPDSQLTNRIFFLSGKNEQRGVEALAGGALLIERIKLGDQEAFNEFYRLYSKMVHGIILSRVPFDEVDDVVQEVFLTAYRKLHSLKNINAPGGWLAAIARNHSIEFYRNRMIAEELPEDIPQPKDSEREAKEILSMIRDLPEAYRETLMMRLAEGMSGNEIAEKTGLKPESVRVNLHRGMNLLRERIGIKERE